jgi:hypothetical protein
VAFESKIDYLAPINAKLARLEVAVRSVKYSCNTVGATVIVLITALAVLSNFSFSPPVLGFLVPVIAAVVSVVVTPFAVWLIRKFSAAVSSRFTATPV